MKIVRVNYKGKYSIAMDEDMVDDMDVVLGEISKQDLIDNAEDIKETCRYYGIDPYIGKDEELNKLFK